MKVGLHKGKGRMQKMEMGRSGGLIEPSKVEIKPRFLASLGMTKVMRSGCARKEKMAG